ncbi:MAG TPA: LysE family translocator [Sphingopyxis sp.]|nr:LysE family translocator [Sphingopyxis sp.]
MMPSFLFALTAFAFVSSITPGPNNVMLMASGANFGLKRTIPHALGITIGFSVMILLVGLGVMALFDRWPALNMALKGISIAYLLWLAWKIANAAGPSQGGDSLGRPMTFFEAALFQWVNPKAWTMILSAIALYAPDRSMAAVLIIASIFGLVNLPTVSLWAIMGQGMQVWLSTPGRLRAFNWTMAGLLLASLALMI